MDLLHGHEKVALLAVTQGPQPETAAQRGRSLKFADTKDDLKHDAGRFAARRNQFTFATQLHNHRDDAHREHDNGGNHAKHRQSAVIGQHHADIHDRHETGHGSTQRRAGDNLANALQAQHPVRQIAHCECVEERHRQAEHAIEQGGLRRKVDLLLHLLQYQAAHEVEAGHAQCDGYQTDRQNGQLGQVGIGHHRVHQGAGGPWHEHAEPAPDKAKAEHIGPLNVGTPHRERHQAADGDRIVVKPAIQHQGRRRDRVADRGVHLLGRVGRRVPDHIAATFGQQGDWCVIGCNGADQRAVVLRPPFRLEDDDARPKAAELRDILNSVALIGQNHRIGRQFHLLAQSRRDSRQNLPGWRCTRRERRGSSTLAPDASQLVQPILLTRKIGRLTVGSERDSVLNTLRDGRRKCTQNVGIVIGDRLTQPACADQLLRCGTDQRDLVPGQQRHHATQRHRSCTRWYRAAILR